MDKNSRELQNDAVHVTASSSQTALLSPVQGPFLGWLSGETLYSLLVRNHIYRGHREPRDTIQAFFGTARGEGEHASLEELDVFVARTEGYLGTAEEVLAKHTLARFYRVFDPHALSQMTIVQMLKLPTMLKRGDFQCLHPLKACPVCIDRDLQDTGMPYWRLKHQYPGTWVCTEHDMVLQESSVSLSSQKRFLWVVPTVEGLYSVPRFLTEEGSFTKLRDLALLIESLIDNPDFGQSYVSQAKADLQNFLERKGMLTRSGKLRIAYLNNVVELCESFIASVGVLRMLPEFSSLPYSIKGAHKLLSQYLNGVASLDAIEQIAMLAWIKMLPRD